KTSELLYGFPPTPVLLERQSQGFYLVQRIQDEVHRFAITFHRNLRGKGLIQSELDTIPGVGEKRKHALLTHFKMLENIKKASVEESTKLAIPVNVATNIINHLNSPKE